MKKICFLYLKTTSYMAGVHSGQILAGSSDLLLVVRYTRLVGVAALEQSLQVVTGEVRPKLFSSTSL